MKIRLFLTLTSLLAIGFSASASPPIVTTRAIESMISDLDDGQIITVGYSQEKAPKMEFTVITAKDLPNHIQERLIFRGKIAPNGMPEITSKDNFRCADIDSFGIVTLVRTNLESQIATQGFFDRYLQSKKKLEISEPRDRDSAHQCFVEIEEENIYEIHSEEGENWIAFRDEFSITTVWFKWEEDAIIIYQIYCLIV